MVVVFLLMGQSNMAGRGPLSGVSNSWQDERVKLLRVTTLSATPQWEEQIAVEPYFNDTPHAEAGLAQSFVQKILEQHPEQRILLVPCAVGGTSIQQWLPQSELYTRALYLANIAKEKGEITAILWHQGESNANAELLVNYQENLELTLSSFRKEIGNENLPIVMGEIGRFLEHNQSGRFPYWQEINQAIHNAARNLGHATVVSSEDLVDKADLLHFDTPSLRTLGLRYAEAYLKFQ
jgi:hypothetical protein